MPEYRKTNGNPEAQAQLRRRLQEFLTILES